MAAISAGKKNFNDFKPAERKHILSYYTLSNSRKNTLKEATNRCKNWPA